MRRISPLAASFARIGDIGEMVEAGDRLAQFAGARGAEHRLDERIELCGEAPALIGDVGGGNAGIVTRREAPAVGELDFELAQGLWPAVLPIESRSARASRSAPGRVAFSAL